jgi:hypothetical protein
MKTIQHDANTIKKLLKKQKIATMPELKSALETDVSMTVIRKLRALSYLTSYSHGGRYYTLPGIPVFDENGLWSYQSVLFSVHGNLQETVKVYVDDAKAGYTSSELKSRLGIETKEALLILYRKHQVYREKIDGCFVYFSVDDQKRRYQRLNRENIKNETETLVHLDNGSAVSDMVWTALRLFFSILNEKQRRLFAGLESLKIGYGGDRRIADRFNMDPHTVAKGRVELLEQKVEPGRIRKKGGGRTPAEKKIPKS